MDITCFPVTLVIKAPNQKIADQTIECERDWTVRKLKEHLAIVYPSKPMEKEQKIIYSGKLLQDHVTLKDVLKQYDPSQTTHTVHLVCSPTTCSHQEHLMNQKLITSSEMIQSGLRQRHINTALNEITVNDTASSTLNLKESSSISQLNITDQIGTSSQSALPVIEPNGLITPENYQTTLNQNFNIGSNIDHAFQMSNIVFPNNFITNQQIRQTQPTQAIHNPYNFYQYTSHPLMHMHNNQQFPLQQFSYLDYWNQYNQYNHYIASFHQQMHPIDPQIANNNISLSNELGQTEPNVAIDPLENQVNPVPEPPMRMNAHGGMEPDDEELPRDWLDYFYLALKFLMLGSIFFFYSTLERVLLTVCLFSLYYLYKHYLRRPENNNRNNAEQNQSTPNADDARPVVEENNENIGLFKLFFTFFLGFFTSLAPQAPPIQNLN